VVQQIPFEEPPRFSEPEAPSGSRSFLGAEAFEEVSFEDPGCEQRNHNSGGEVVIAGSGAIAGPDAIAAVG
jgi:hypothetical protein